MPKKLHFPFVVFILVALPSLLAAQVTRDPVSQNEPVQKIAPLPANVNPEDIQKPDPAAGEKKQQVSFSPGETKRISPKNEGSGTQQKQEYQQTRTDKHGNPVGLLPSLQKPENTPPGNTEEQQAAGSEVARTDGLTYPDLQVTATQESPQIQVFQGSERLPKPIAEKTETSAPVEKISAPDTNNTSSIGKVSFLKQYVSELKAQIEKNKNKANYPLAEKQQELLQLENLLKGE